MSALLEIDQLSRRYGNNLALDSVDLEIAEGSVLGLIGRNGAGKTTLIRHVMGLLRAQSGTVRCFGRDPVRSPELTLSKIGYVSEERDLPGWMRIEELMRYTKAFYPNWDDSLAAELCTAFDLDPKQKVKTLSRGQHVRTSLLLALTPRPPLLVLDEPSSGLDPVVRRDVLEAVIRHVAHEGRTVLFSSHLLDEVERISDHLAMIDRGKMLFSEPLETILDEFRQVILKPLTPGMERCDSMQQTLVGLGAVRRCVSLPAAADETSRERSFLCRFEGDPEEGELGSLLKAADLELVELLPVTLDQIFLNLSSEDA